MQKNIQKMFSVFEILASELVALNCLHEAVNACHRRSMC